MFIKLTGLEGDKFYLDPETIVEIDTFLAHTDIENQLERATRIFVNFTRTGLIDSCHVKESPEEILNKIKECEK